MRNRLRMVSVAAGILIAVSLPVPSSASSAGEAPGWRQEEGGWAYYGQDGQRAVNTWIRSGDGQTSYYLDEGGAMATDRLIEDGNGTYYVDGSGEQARNRWVALPNDGLWEEPVETVYYYVGSDGKAFKDVKKKIGGKPYFFDQEGRMLSGWYEEDGEVYYLGTEDEGWAHTGWQRLTGKDPEEGYGFEQWYYFRPSNGKACRGKKVIDGSSYYFDEDTAAMQEGWLELEKGGHAYYEPKTGRLMTGWVFNNGPDEGDEAWFYLDDEGVPFNEGGKDAEGRNSDGDIYFGKGIDYISVDFHWNMAARTIHGDTYLFNEDGRMQTGRFYLWEVRNVGGKILGGKIFVDGNFELGGIYHFDDRDEASKGKMLKGLQKVTTNGTDYDFCFDTNGMAYASYIKDGYLYGQDGVRICAESWEKYHVVEVPGEETDEFIMENGRKHTNCLMIVDRRGKVKKNGTVTFNGYRYTVKNYEVVGTPEELD